MNKRNMNFLILNKCNINRGWLLSFILSILGQSIEGLQLQDRYMGCFDYINVTARVTTRNNSDLNGTQLTIDKCIATCRQQVASYAALQNGSICHCVDDFGIQQSDDACKVMCAGNQFEYCGGTAIEDNTSPMRGSVYAVCPVGNYGSACHQVCHCRRQIPCRRVTGKCPDGCAGNYTGPSCNITSLREQYIGCYRDMNDDRALTHRPYARDARQTLEVCTRACADANSSYAGAQFTYECHCGENYNKHGRLKEENNCCSSRCPGNTNTFCGGVGASSIYSVCPFGRYGKGCIEKCNCLNNTRCLYLNGSCPLSLCKAGWTGTSCNIRDCTSHNGDCHQNETCLTVDLVSSKLSSCRCSDGFHRRKIWENCIDKDECIEMPLVCGQHALNCTNTIGGYQCFCPNGLTEFNMSCMTENGSSQKMVTVGAILGSVFCLSVVLAVTVLLCKYRHKGPNIKSTTSGNVCRFGDSAIPGTTCTEESHYEGLSRRSDDTNVYQQIAMTQSQM